MKLGYVGLGKMGLNMVLRLLEKGHQLVVFDASSQNMELAKKTGAEASVSLEELAGKLQAPRLIWIMVPYAEVDSVLEKITPFLSSGDTVIDGGNSPYKESERRSKELAEKGIHFLDAGVSGGPHGAREGACVMVGGEPEVFQKYADIFRDIAVEGGYGYMGKAGAGHFVKMIHNGIEYGMMQALAEGFSILKSAEFGFNLKNIADLYNHRSVIESRLVGWLKDAYEKYGAELQDVSGVAAHTGEGAWTVETAKELGVPVPIIKNSLEFRIASKKNPNYSGKILSALRNQFGGHEAKAV